MEVRVEQAASIVVIRGTYLFIYLKIQVSRFVSYWSCKNPGSVLKQSKLKNEFSPNLESCFYFWPETGYDAAHARH
jgi:hypothetical protein